MRLWFAAALVFLAGCGDQATISKGGRVPSEILTVYTLLPKEGPRAEATQQMMRGAKLALSEAGGKVGDLTIQFASADLPDSPDEEPVAAAVREIIRDTGTIAVIGDLDRRTARTTVPLLNGAGILHVSPGTGATGFLQPAEAPTFFPLVPPDTLDVEGKVAIEAEPGYDLTGTTDTARADTVVYAGSDYENARGVVTGVLEENRRADVILTQELATTDLARTLGPRVRAMSSWEGTPSGFAETFPGVEPGRFAIAGYTAMIAVLDAIRRAEDAQVRADVIAAFRAPGPGPLRLVD